MWQQVKGATGMLVAIAAVRFLLMPVLSLALVDLGSRAGLLPADPACRLALLIVVSLAFASELSDLMPTCWRRSCCW